MPGGRQSEVKGELGERSEAKEDMSGVGHPVSSARAEA